METGHMQGRELPSGPALQARVEFNGPSELHEMDVVVRIMMTPPPGTPLPYPLEITGKIGHYKLITFQLFDEPTMFDDIEAYLMIEGAVAPLPVGVELGPVSLAATADVTDEAQTYASLNLEAMGTGNILRGSLSFNGSETEKGTFAFLSIETTNPFTVPHTQTYQLNGKVGDSTPFELQFPYGPTLFLNTCAFLMTGNMEPDPIPVAVYFGSVAKPRHESQAGVRIILTNAIITDDGGHGG